MTGSSRLIDFCAEEAARRLGHQPEPAPFGAMLDAGGSPHGIEGGASLDALRREMDELMANGVVRATAFTEMLPRDAERGTIRILIAWGNRGLDVMVPYGRHREGLFWGKHKVRLGEAIVEERDTTRTDAAAE